MKRGAWLANVAMATVVRRLTYLALAALLGYFAVGKAHAQTGYNRSFSEAMSECKGYTPGSYPGAVCTDHPYPPGYSVVSSGYVAGRLNGARVGPYWEYRKDPTCPTGQSINPATHTCFTMPTEQECLARNEDAKKPNVIQFSGNACMNNCSYGPINPGFERTINGTTYRSGEMGYTGEVCNVPPPTPPPTPEQPEQKCIPINGQTVCIQPEDGKLCYSGGSSSSMVCWKPGETGEKTDGPIKHVVAPGTNPGTPSPPLPGDTQTPTGTATTITTTGPSNVTNTTTHSTFVAGSGNNAGPRNSGQPLDGKTGPDGKDESKGTASGGGDCKTAPACAGDAILCAINENTWRAGCRGDDNGDGQPDWTEGEKPGDPGEGEPGDEPGVREIGIGADLLDQTDIFGGGSCPNFTMNILGQAVTSADIPAWCDIVAIMRTVILIMGAFIALRLLMGG